MAIDRLKNTFGANQVTSGLAPENWAYANTSTGDVTPYTFVGDGTAGTVNGGIYRVHRWEYAPTQTSWGVTFNQAGIIDLLVVGGGAGGRGSYTNAYSAGGGGAGGLILQFNYGVTATTYNVGVGKGGQYLNQGDDYYQNGPYAPEDSTFGSGFTAIAGGRAGVSYSPPAAGYSGGSGGGASAGSQVSAGAGGAGTAGQGNSGGSARGASPQYNAAGGGGYLTQGEDAPDDSYAGGAGGDGLANYRFDGFSRGYAAGGGGAGYSNGTGGAGGAGGGGQGGTGSGNPGGDASGVGCGGGGVSGGVTNVHGGKGSHGMVIVRYRVG